MITCADGSVLITFSVPFIPVFYLLHASASGGVKFGVLGFCTGTDGGNGGGTCKPKQYVYLQIPHSICAMSCDTRMVQGGVRL